MCVHNHEWLTPLPNFILYFYNLSGVGIRDPLFQASMTLSVFLKESYTINVSNVNL